MSKRVLLIDDDFSDEPGSPCRYMWYYVQALRDCGYEVTPVTSTDHALEHLTKHSFDLVLLDVMMPPGKNLVDAGTAGGVRTGVVLADRLAQAHPHTPVVILTNANDPADLEAL